VGAMFFECQRLLDDEQGGSIELRIHLFSWSHLYWIKNLEPMFNDSPHLGVEDLIM
jgi:hypothetical protein